MGCAYPFLLVSIIVSCALTNAAPVGNADCKTYCSMGFLCFTRCGNMYKRNEATTDAPVAYADEVHQNKNTNELSSLYDDLTSIN